MRISDLSTFDSKPILLSQFAELLNSNNITMQGNQVNVPSGLVLLDNKGKIPEDADIQRIFYIDGEFPTTDLVKNSLYVNSTGEARATNENAEYINISLQVVNDFSTVSDDTVVTSKAIKDFVETKVADIQLPSGVLSLETIEDFPSSGTNDTLYIDKNNQVKVYADNDWKDISLEVVENLDSPNQTTVPTTQAVKAYVDANAAAPTYTKVIINQSDFSNDDSTYTLNGETGGKYYELNGICDVTVTNADGYVIGLDVRYMFETVKTRLYIPNSLAAGTITNWTIVYLVKTIA